MDSGIALMPLDHGRATTLSFRLRRLVAAHPAALRLAFTAVLLAFLVHFVGWGELAAGLSRARWRWLAAMYSLSLLAFAVSAASMHVLLSKSGLNVSLGRVLLVNALSNLYALVLPGDLVAGASKWVMLSSATGQRAKVLTAIVLNKIANGLPPLLFGSLALVFHNPLPQLPVGEVAVAVASVAVVSIFLVLNRRVGPLIDGWIQRAARTLPERLRGGVEKLIESLAAFRALRWSDHLQVLTLCSLAFWFMFLGFLCATRALGLDVPVATLLWTMLTLFVSRLLPITFNNLGVREGVLILAFGTIQVEPALALGVGLVMFSNAIWIGLLGAGCQLAVALGWVGIAGEGALDGGRRRQVERP